MRQGIVISAMTNSEISEQIADLIHQTMRRAYGGVSDISAAVGASQNATDVRSELMYCAAQLKRADLSDEIIGKVEANIRTANAAGFVSDGAHDTIMKKLGELE